LGFSAVKTIRAKQEFEQMAGHSSWRNKWLAIHQGVVVESYLTDSGAFTANAFVKQIREHEQRIRYCGANAHHKNRVAERAVQSVSNMARAMLLHLSAHWKNGIDSSLWPMAVTYATYLYNHLPNASGLCPADLFTGSTVPRHRLQDIHVWGCPVYTLDPILQAGKKFPRWEPRSNHGVFMGFSHLHSSKVPLVLNSATRSITPQYHVDFDDHFSTVISVEREMDPPEHWAELCLDNTTFNPLDTATETALAPRVGGTMTEDGVELAADWQTSDLTTRDDDFITRALQRQDAIRDTYSIEPASTTVLPFPKPLLSGLSTISIALSGTVSEPHIVEAPSVVTDMHDRKPPPLISRAQNPPDAVDPTLRRSTQATKGVFKQTRYIDEAYHTSLGL
jgi:hypothetical protein